MIRNTSLKAWQEHQESGNASTQRIRILNHIRNYSEGLTRNEISRELGITINATCGRCRKLVQDGLIREDGTKRDNVTGKKNLILKA